MKVIIVVGNKGDFDMVENILREKIKEEGKIIKIPSKVYKKKVQKEIKNKSLRVEFKVDELVIDNKQYFFFHKKDLTIEVIDNRNPEAVISLDDSHFAVFYKKSSEFIEKLLDENLTKNYSQILKLDYEIIENDRILDEFIDNIINNEDFDKKLTKNPRKYTSNILNIKNIIKPTSKNYPIFLGNVRNGEFKEGDIVYLYDKEGNKYKSRIGNLQIGDERNEIVTEGSFCGFTLDDFNLEKSNFEFISTEEVEFTNSITLSKLLTKDCNNKKVKILCSEGERYGIYKDGIVKLFNPICKEFLDTIFDISVIDEIRFICEVDHDFY